MTYKKILLDSCLVKEWKKHKFNLYALVAEEVPSFSFFFLDSLLSELLLSDREFLNKNKVLILKTGSTVKGDKGLLTFLKQSKEEHLVFTVDFPFFKLLGSKGMFFDLKKRRIKKIY